MKPEEIAGFWWLPEAPDRRSYGTLTYDGHGYPQLALQETLSDVEQAINGATLIGLSAEAEEVTAEVDFETRRTHRSTAKGHTIQGQTVGIKRAFVGAHLPEPDDRQFTHISVELSDLLPWTTWRGIEDSWTPESVGFQYTPPDEPCAELPWGRLCMKARYGISGDGVSTRSISIGAAWVGERTDPAIVEVWLDEVVRPLRDFLTIATDRANQVEAVSLWNESASEQVRLIHAPVSVELPPRVGYWFDFPLTAETIADDFSGRLARWFELQSELAPALDLYLSTQYRPSMHLENRFLNTAGAAEALHRRRFVVSQEVRDKHAKRVQRIADAVSNSKDRALLKRLKYAYEPSFYDRVRALHERTKGVFYPWLGEAADFAERVSRSRNALVHRDPEAADAIPDGRSMLDMTEDLALIFVVCLFQDLGLDDANIRQMLEERDRWRFMQLRKRDWSD